MKLSKKQSGKIPFWKCFFSGKSVTITGDGIAIQSSSHGWKEGHPMLDGMCLNCGFDEKTCSCKNPKIQNPR